MLSDGDLVFIADEACRNCPSFDPDELLRVAARAVANAAAQAERHRIYAALEADPSALWRDQGFQEWRRNRGADSVK